MQHTKESKTENLKQLLTEAETSEYLGGLSPLTLRRWRSVGEGPDFVKLGPSRNAPVRYRIADLEAWIRPGRPGDADAA